MAVEPADALLNLHPLLACPHDGGELVREGALLRCANGHRFAVVQDVPVLLREDVPQTIWLSAASLRLAWAQVEGKNDDPWFVETFGKSEASGVTAVVRAAKRSCQNAAKAQKSTPLRGSSGQSRLALFVVRRYGHHRAASSCIR